MEVINKIIEFLFGRKYYANIFNTRGTIKCDISSFIFPDKYMADEHRRKLENNRSFKFVETISFRSRNFYMKGCVNNIECSVIS